MPIRILLADDHQILRQGLKAVLEREEFKVVGEATRVGSVTRHAATKRPTTR
jgi:two-component system, NarL family, response regulator DevR